jgi:hypothetical protein
MYGAFSGGLFNERKNDQRKRIAYHAVAVAYRIKRPYRAPVQAPP